MCIFFRKQVMNIFLHLTTPDYGRPCSIITMCEPTLTLTGTGVLVVSRGQDLFSEWKRPMTNKNLGIQSGKFFQEAKFWIFFLNFNAKLWRTLTHSLNVGADSNPNLNPKNTAFETVHSSYYDLYWPLHGLCWPLHDHNILYYITMNSRTEEKHQQQGCIIKLVCYRYLT